jgi:zinc/manganese transport system ATP-binding protein
MSEAVRLHDVTLGYERHPAVHHLNGAFQTGSLTAVVGPNGSGKSTLLRGMAGALEPLAGRIDLQGLKPRDVAYLPQDPGVDRAFPMTLGELVALGFWSRRGLFGGLTREDRDRLGAAFEAVGLGGFEERPLNAVSGGQFQRALFARVLIQDAKLILLDEPFSAVDQKTTADLVELLERWPREGRTVIMVLHDLDLVRETCADALLLAREMVAWGPAKETLRPENLLEARRLSEAFDEHAHVCKREA